jgi:hypothetical protein
VRLPSVLTKEDFPDAELQALRLDGEAFELTIAGCYAAVDEIVGTSHRALALSKLIHPRLVAELQTAAWIYGLIESAPQPHTLCADLASRISGRTLIEWGAREVSFSEGDLVTIAGMTVTTPRRIINDLVRFKEDFTPADETLVRRLLEFGGIEIIDCLRALDGMVHLTHKRRAAERLVGMAQVAP